MTMLRPKLSGKRCFAQKQASDDGARQSIAKSTAAKPTPASKPTTRAEIRS